MSAAPVFSAASIAGCIFTVLVSIALPVAALAVLKRKTGDPYGVSLGSEPSTCAVHTLKHLVRPTAGETPGMGLEE